MPFYFPFCIGNQAGVGSVHADGIVPETSVLRVDRFVV